MSIAAHPVESSLLTRLATGTAGAVGKEFLRCLVTELAGALDADMAFVAERCGDGEACTLASFGKPGVELREGQVFTLAGTPCEDAYTHDLLLVSRGARLRYPEDAFLRRYALDGYLAVALRDGRTTTLYVTVLLDGGTRRTAVAVHRLAELSPPDDGMRALRDELAPLLTETLQRLGDTAGDPTAVEALPPLADRLSDVLDRYA